ncbi:MAG: hypothetical protein V7711_18695 [Pseudomonadales bacterium]
MPENCPLTQGGAAAFIEVSLEVAATRVALQKLVDTLAERQGF